MKKETIVWIKTSFEGFHYWVDAPDEVAYLRSPHRHIFHVKLGVSVTGLDREVEFHTLKNQVTNYLGKKYCQGYPFQSSCEMIAHDLLDTFRATIVEVSEDGENGASVWLEKEEV